MAGSSSHGGAREGSGRKRKFQNGGVTTSIMAPKEYKDKVQKIVEIIDSLLAEGFSIEQIEALLRKMGKD